MASTPFIHPRTQNPNMYPPREIIDISDDDGDGSDDHTYGFDEDLFVNDNEIENDVQALNIDRHNIPALGGIRNLIDTYQSCLQEVLEVFPDISHDHVQKLYDERLGAAGPDQPLGIPVAQILVERILDSGTYPKEKDRMRELKRKRSDKDVDEEEAAKWKYMDLRDDPAEYARVAKAALQEAFEYVPAKFIQDIFKEHGHYYGAFFAILKAERDYKPMSNMPFSRLKTRRVSNGVDAKTLMRNLQMAGHDFEALKKEMDSAFQRRKREDSLRVNAQEVERSQAAQDQENIAKGEVMDCGCCCETVTVPRMTHCNGDEPHFFCLDCARRNANNDIGNSQYKLKCMDFSDCNSSFSREQRLRFLDSKTIEKLERLQQQDEIRLAELDNLSNCPFCDFVAICPPVEEDKEFRCHNPHCEEVSCRLCKLKSHIPLSCEEYKKENGISERRVIEEARTEALIRTCGKCKVRILKEDGCNKVICTSCYAVLCDYCGKDITKVMYNHFDGDSGRAPPGLITVPGGKCPLYDESNKRKDQQVDAAEKEAMAKVRAEHPELSEEDLRIKFAKGIEKSPDRHHRHHRPHFGWPVPPVHPFHPNAGDGHLPGFADIAPRFGPGFPLRQENLAGAQLEPLLGMGQDLRRLREQTAILQQQAAHRAQIQAQEQRQQMQRQLDQLRMQQGQQHAQAMQQAQNHINLQRARFQADMDRNRERMFRGRTFDGADAPLGGNGLTLNDDQSMFNPFDADEMFGGPNGPPPRLPNQSVNQPHDEAQLRQRATAARLSARRGEQAERRARLHRPEMLEPPAPPRQDRHQPRRRNATPVVDRASQNPWI